jgi:hypothetical protein
MAPAYFVGFPRLAAAGEHWQRAQMRRSIRRRYEFKSPLDDDAMIEYGDGIRSGPHKTEFAGNALLFVDGSLPIEEGDVVMQTLPGGRELRRVAIEVSDARLSLAKFS